MTLKRKVALATIGALVLAGGGTALATTGHGHGKKAAATHGTLFAAKSAGSAWAGAAPFGKGFGRGGAPGGELAVAATYLGITSDVLKSDLQSGKTLAQIADATAGESAAGLIDALVASEKSALDAAVTAGKLTQAQEQTLLASLQQRVTDLVNGTRPAFPGPGKGFGPGSGFGHGGGFGQHTGRPGGTNT
jgi:hypothetical protein